MYPKLIKIIFAHDNKNGIGKHNSIPWNYKLDMQYFNNITKFVQDKNKQNAVIMGFNTFLSLPKLLPDRLNIVITSNNKDNEKLNDILNFQNLSKCMKYLNTQDNIESIFIIGGKRLYDGALKLNMWDELFITKINKDYDCDIILDNFEIPEKYLIKETKFEDLTFYKYSKIENNNVNKEEQSYLDLMYKIINLGEKRQTRNSITYSIFGEKLEFDLQNFPLLTTKKMFIRGIFEELMFFLRGQTDSKILEEKNVNIWKGNTSREFLDSVGLKHYKEGDCGAMYGFIWNHYGAEYKNCSTDYTGQGYNQLDYVVNLLNNDNKSRRIMMTTYDPIKAATQSCLYPCHGLIVQFYVRNNKYLDCQIYIRSSDVFLGLPFNIASYAILINLMCKSKEINNYLPGKMIIILGDTHIYEEHIEFAKKQILRTGYKFCKLNIKTNKNLRNYEFEDIELINYISEDSIKVNMVA